MYAVPSGDFLDVSAVLLHLELSPPMEQLSNVVLTELRHFRLAQWPSTFYNL